MTSSHDFRPSSTSQHGHVGCRQCALDLVSLCSILSQLDFRQVEEVWVTFVALALEDIVEFIGRHLIKYQLMGLSVDFLFILSPKFATYFSGIYVLEFRRCPCGVIHRNVCFFMQEQTFRRRHRTSKIFYADPSK